MPPPAAPPTLIAVAHGSRDPAAPHTVRALLERVRALRPQLRVELAHIELNAPLLTGTLAAHRPGAAVLVPLLFGRGHHVRHDLPEAARAAGHLRLSQAAPLGPHPLLAEALYDRLAEALRTWPGRTGPHRDGHPRPDGVVLAAAGSRDPRSATDAERTAALLSRRLGGVPVLPGYASAAAPTVPRAVAALRADGCRRVALASYFTAPGLFAARCARDAGPGVPAAAPLGDHPALARLVLHRYDEALARAARGPGTACGSTTRRAA
ncbi:sirohydrochlorin chelatase [Streptomyces sp. TRM 70351]|uniref:sirohydrochlorin chelatase n=1 Tax=Streptomyces sp. TRM 70351 TaxID=3116552 RepID=UPI002E7B0B0B|nr:sirohydrochlorin chelatase [Streptomyces sp. TRM 70351]MEE1928476.1 sirohydrochlorin chelatase [Streptomyces sp. TRM 70351]